MPDYDPKSIPILDDIIDEDIVEPELSTDVLSKNGLNKDESIEDQLANHDLIKDEALDAGLNNIPELTEPVAENTEFIDISARQGDEENIDRLNLFAGNDLAEEKETAGPELGIIHRYLDFTSDSTADATTNPTDDDFTSIEEDAPASALLDYSTDQPTHQYAAQPVEQHLENRTDPDETVGSVDQDIQVFSDSAISEAAFTEINAEQAAADPLQATTLKAIVDDVVEQLMPDLEQQLRQLVRQALEEKLPQEISERLSDKKPTE